MAKRTKNEFMKRKPNTREVSAAQKLAKRVSKVLYEMMEGKEIKD